MFTTYTPFLITTVGLIFNKNSRKLLHSTCNVESQQNIYLSMAGEENVNHNKNQNKKEDTEKKGWNGLAQRRLKENTDDCFMYSA